MRLYLYEKRAHADRNPRIDKFEALEKYKSDPSVFIHYTNLEKLGVNPQTDFETPAGIYGYPLREMWGAFTAGKIPFASERKYIQVFRVAGRVLDVERYSESNLRADVEKLRAVVERKFPKAVAAFWGDEKGAVIDKDWDDEIQDCRKSAFVGTPAGVFWYIVRRVSFRVSRAYSRKSIWVWNGLFRDLGYGGVVDRKGRGIIHKNEPLQGVFFDARAVKHIDMVVNQVPPGPDQV
jgi:hypothetical protein